MGIRQMLIHGCPECLLKGPTEHFGKQSRRCRTQEFARTFNKFAKVIFYQSILDLLGTHVLLKCCTSLMEVSRYNRGRLKRAVMPMYVLITVRAFEYPLPIFMALAVPMVSVRPVVKENCFDNM